MSNAKDQPQGPEVYHGTTRKPPPPRTTVEQPGPTRKTVVSDAGVQKRPA